MHFNLNFILYAIGSICVAYILLIILRHIILYYIAWVLKKMFRLQAIRNNKKKNDAPSNREDELKRDRQAEIAKQNASDLKNKIKQNEDDVLEVNPQQVGQRGGSNTFANSNSRLEMGQESGRIVGVVKPIGKWTNLVLGRKMSQIASMMQHQQEVGLKDKGYWTSYIRARGQVEKGAGRQ